MLESKEGKHIVIMDIIRIINIMNFILLVGLFFVRLKINQYVSLIIILIISVVLELFTRKLFAKKFGDNHFIAKNKIYVGIVIVLNVAILFYYIWVKQYIVVAIIIMFYISYSVYLKSIGANKKAN